MYVQVSFGAELAWECFLSENPGIKDGTRERFGAEVGIMDNC